MMACLKRVWWAGPLVVGFAVAAITTIQVTITIGDAFIRATRIKPITLPEPGVHAPRTFEERWTSPSDWKAFRTEDSTRE